MEKPNYTDVIEIAIEQMKGSNLTTTLIGVTLKDYCKMKGFKRIPRKLKKYYTHGES